MKAKIAPANELSIKAVKNQKEQLFLPIGGGQVDNRLGNR